MSRALTHLRANAVAYLALFLALSSGAYAINKAQKNSVVSKSIKDGQVKNKDLGKGAVGAENLGAGAIPPPTPQQTGVVRTPRIAIDDPIAGGTTTATLLQSGPFTVIAVCGENNATKATPSIRVISTEAGHVAGKATTLPEHPDTLPANEEVAIVGTPTGQSINENNAHSYGLHALTNSGAYLSLGVVGVSKPAGDPTTDCAFQANGFAGP